MDKFDRIYVVHTALNGRRTPLPFEDLAYRLLYLGWLFADPSRNG